jgi:alpha-methylacyl-CoA racemase
VTQQPLDGIRVLDFTTLLPGPLATLMLAACGADVIKIEPPEGDGMRRLGLGERADDAVFSLLNAGKRCCRVNLKERPGLDRVLALAREADVLVEQFRPGVMTRLGLGYEALRDINPRLVYCSITGYGQTGPLSERAGHDLTYLSETGILALSPGDPASPSVPPVLAADIGAGSYPAFMNILLALMARERGGAGAHLDIAMTDGLFPFAFWALAQGWGAGVWPEAGTQLLNGGSPRYHIYPAQDGALVAVAAIEDRFWDRFCEAISVPGELRDPAVESARVIAVVAEIIEAQPGAHWRGVFEDADCCCSVVDTLEEAVNNAHFIGRGLFSGSIATKGGATIPALPLPLARLFRLPVAANSPTVEGEEEGPQWRTRSR